jgi:hypothetical protein
VAALAWFGVALDVTLSATDNYSHAEIAAHAYGNNPTGAAGALPRVIDTLSYFTVWSNVVVALAFTLLALQARRAATSGERPTGDRFSRLARVLLLDALVMITVTAIVYQVVLAPDANPTGVAVVTNFLEHQAVPVLSVLAWLVVGPRRAFDRRTFSLLLVVPVVWVVYMLVRGAFIDAYPYPFVNVSTNGYASVAVALCAILAFGLALAALYTGLDKVLSQRR